MDELDGKLRKAMHALERSVPDGYFDELTSRIEARLEGVTMTETETDHEHDHGPPPNGHGHGHAQAHAASGDDESDDHAPREESSGLHDIKQLAKSQKQHISRRISTQSDAEASLLHASSSGMRAVALPEPSKEVADPMIESSAAPVAARLTATATATAARPASSVSTDSDEARGGLPMWIYAAVGAVAVAAVVFFVVRGGGDKAAKSPAGDVVAVAGGTPAPAAAAVPAAAPRAATIAPIADATGSRGPSVETLPTGEGEAAVASANETGMGDITGKPVAIAAAPGAAAGSAKAGHDNKTDAPARTTAPTKPGKGAGVAPDGDKAAETPVATEGSTAPTDKPAADTGKAAAGGAGASLEALLDEASGGAANPTAVAEEKKKPTKTKLDSGDVRQGMQGVAAQGCFDKFSVPGNVQIRFTVEPSGQVSKAAATGSFKGTDTGSCVASLVSKVSFPAFEGAPMSFTFPFLLTE